MSFPWDDLRISETSDERTIRRAYAQRLKSVHPEDDPEGFQLLRQAYEYALMLASFAGTQPIEQSPAANEPSSPDAATVLDVESPAARGQGITERAQELVGALLEVHNNSGIEEALKMLRARFQSEEFENVELRLRFEQTLSEVLIAEKSPAYELLDGVAGEFGWNKSHSYYAVVHLMDRLESWREYRNLLQLRDSPARRGGRISLKTPVVTPMQARVADMLTSPFNPRKFWTNQILFLGLTEAVQAHIARLEAYSPATIDEFLDPKTVEWWTQRQPTVVKAIAVVVAALVVIATFVINNDLSPWIWVIPASALALFLVGLRVSRRYSLSRVLAKRLVFVSVSAVAVILIIGAVASLILGTGTRLGALIFMVMLIRGIQSVWEKRKS